MRRLVPLVLVSGCAGSPDPAASPCDDDPRAEALFVGSTVAGASLSVRVDALDPEPPIAGDNDWQLSVLDGGGAALSGCAITVTPFMPDHGHGSTVGDITEVDGRYTVSDLALRMGGYWEVTVTLDCGEAGDDEVLIPVCVDA